MSQEDNFYMNYTIEKLENSKVKFVIETTADELESATQEAYEKNKHKYGVEGFRKGHVPRKVLESVYGKGLFYEDALDIILPKYFDEVLIKEPEIEPVGKPEADIIAFEETGVKFSVTVAVKPDVKLGKYKGLKVKKTVEAVTDEQVEAELKLAQDRQARIEEVTEDRASVNGDFLTIDFEGKVDGAKFDGGSAQGYDLELGSGTFIPGFEEQLVGVKKGDVKDVKVTFPKEYGAQNLAGKDAVFTVTVHAIKVKELPELNDEFAKDVSEFDTLAEYKEDVKKQLVAEAESAAEQKVENELMDKITQKSEVVIPDEMVESQIDERIQELEYRLMYQGMKLDDYCKMINTDVAKIREDYKESAALSVKTRLVMEAIIKAENLMPTEDEINEKVADFAKGANKSAEEYRKQMHERQLNYIVNSIATDKLLAFLKSNNTVQ